MEKVVWGILVCGVPLAIGVWALWRMRDDKEWTEHKK